MTTLTLSCLRQGHTRSSEKINPRICFPLFPGVLQSRWLQQDSTKWLMGAIMWLTAFLPGTFCATGEVTLLGELLAKSSCSSCCVHVGRSAFHGVVGQLERTFSAGFLYQLHSGEPRELKAVPKKS